MLDGLGSGRGMACLMLWNLFPSLGLYVFRVRRAVSLKRSSLASATHGQGLPASHQLPLR